MLHTIDTERGLYVIQEGAGYSCLGFDYAYSRAKAVAQWANSPMPIESHKGTQLGYEEYTRTMQDGSMYAQRTGKRCEIELTPQLVGLEGKRVEVIDSSGETRRFYVGKSTGWMPCHLEIARRNSSGGPAILRETFKSIRIIGTR